MTKQDKEKFCVRLNKWLDHSFIFLCIFIYNIIVKFMTDNLHIELSEIDRFMLINFINSFAILFGIKVSNKLSNFYENERNKNGNNTGK